jgi:hypothetical protein
MNAIIIIINPGPTLVRTPSELYAVGVLLHAEDVQLERALQLRVRDVRLAGGDIYIGFRV